MGFTSQTLTAKFELARSSKITNFTAAAANTEYTHILQTNLKQLFIQSRNYASTQVAFTSTESGTKFITIHSGCSLTLNDIDFSSTTLYLQSSKNNSIIEILELY